MSVESRFALRDQIFQRGSLALALSVGVLIFVGFGLWTAAISFTSSGLLPDYEFVGWEQYRRLFSSARWWVTLRNVTLAGGVLVLACCSLGYILAALIDGSKRMHGIYIAVFMLPLSMSFVASGIVWKAILNPSTGIETFGRQLGFVSFDFDWLVSSSRSIYAATIVGIWQQIGMCMLLFLAGFRSIDENIVRAANVDGAPAWRTHVQVIMPMLWHVFAMNFVLLCAFAVKSFDVIVVLTGGGPGFSSDVPARFVMEHIFERQELGLASAGASVMVAAVVLAMAPYLYIVWSRRGRRA
jgi:glucose/mannose transport system permease protein